MKFYTRGNNIIGEFRLGKGESGTHGNRIKLCTVSELETKPSGRKRSEREKANLVSSLYQKKLAELLSEKKKEGIEKKILEPLFNKYMIEREPYLAQKSVTKYRNSFSHFITALNKSGIKANNAFDPRKVESALISHFREIGFKSPEKPFGHMRTFIRWGIENSFLQSKQLIALPKATKKIPKTLNGSQLRDLESTILSSKSRNRENALRAYMLMRYTGMRASEVVNLKLEDIDIERKLIYIRDNDDTDHSVKGGHEESVPIAEKLGVFLNGDIPHRALKSVYYLEYQNKQAYTRPENLTRVFSRYLSQIGIEEVKPLHIFRYTLATELSQKGVNVQAIQKILRHKDIQTTLRYVNAASIETKPIVDLL